MKPKPGLIGRLTGLLPIMRWLPMYQRGMLPWDILAGVTLAFFVLPESMAYATLAGLPPETGIYCCIAGGLLFALFTTSHQLAVGPTSAISLMIGTTVATMAGGDAARWLQIASLTALVVAGMAFFAYLLKLSIIVNFISESVLLGFKAGAALSIISTQLPKLFGIHGEGSDFVERMWELIRHLDNTNSTVLMFGLGALALLIAGQYLLPGKPVSLLVVILSIILVSNTTLFNTGLILTGQLPAGMPVPGMPHLVTSHTAEILGLALACFLMGYIETISAGRILGEKNGYTINPRQELLSMAAANTASAIAGGYVVSGGLSQSTVNDRAGAKSPLALIIHSLVLIFMLSFFTGFLKNLPEVILAVIVIHAVAGLVKIDAMKKLYRLSRTEFGIAMTALAGVLLMGILEGVLLASLISVLMIIKRAASPPVAVLGMIPGTEMFSDIARHPDNRLIDGMVILRIESSVFYFNETAIREQIDRHLGEGEPPVRWLIIDLSAAPYIDVGGSKMLRKLADDLRSRGIGFRIAEALSEARDMLRKLGVEDVTGHISRKVSLFEVVEELRGRDPDGVQTLTGCRP